MASCPLQRWVCGQCFCRSTGRSAHDVWAFFRHPVGAGHPELMAYPIDTSPGTPCRQTHPRPCYILENWDLAVLFSEPSLLRGKTIQNRVRSLPLDLASPCALGRPRRRRAQGGGACAPACLLAPLAWTLPEDCLGFFGFLWHSVHTAEQTSRQMSVGKPDIILGSSLDSLRANQWHPPSSR